MLWAKEAGSINIANEGQEAVCTRCIEGLLTPKLYSKLPPAETKGISWAVVVWGLGVLPRISVHQWRMPPLREVQTEWFVPVWLYLPPIPAVACQTTLAAARGLSCPFSSSLDALKWLVNVKVEVVLCKSPERNGQCPPKSIHSYLLKNICKLCEHVLRFEGLATMTPCFLFFLHIFKDSKYMDSTDTSDFWHQCWEADASHLQTSIIPSKLIQKHKHRNNDRNSLVQPVTKKQMHEKDMERL